MSFTASHGEHGALLVVSVEGAPSLSELCELADSTAARALAAGQSLVLFDLLEARIVLPFTDHMRLGAHVAQSFESLERVATVVRAEYKVGTSEKVAQRSGLLLKAFTDLDEALAWLKAGRGVVSAETDRRPGRSKTP